MALVSWIYAGIAEASDKRFFYIIDSEFGKVGSEIEYTIEIGFGHAVAIVREYIKRELPVGKNLALLTLYQHKRHNHSIEQIKTWHELFVGKHFENWDAYAKERDEHLEKLLVLA